MEKDKKIEVIKKLEDAVAFREYCLNIGNWADYDRAEGRIKTLEREIVSQE